MPGRGRLAALQAMLVVGIVAVGGALGDLRVPAAVSAWYLDMPAPPRSALTMAALPDAPVPPAPAVPAAVSPAPVSSAPSELAAPDAPSTHARVSRPLAPSPSQGDTPTLAASADAGDVEAVLRRFARAHDDLDVRAAQAVWPSVDAGALARSFRRLASQSVAFDRCIVDVQALVARAECQGRTTTVRTGSAVPHTEARTWQFRLRKFDDGWQVLRVDAR